MSELKKEWYVVNTYVGQENRVKENLERRIKTMGLEDFLFQIVVAEEKEIEIVETGHIGASVKPDSSNSPAAKAARDYSARMQRDLNPEFE